MAFQARFRSLSGWSPLLLGPGAPFAQRVCHHSVKRHLSARPARHSSAATVSPHASEAQQAAALTGAQPTASGYTLSDRLNPPASTRPAPLSLPDRDPNASRPAHLYKLAKAYLVFYKNGLKAIRVNYRVLGDLQRASKDTPEAALESTRAAVLLRERTRHDVSRLPLFGLIIILTGEFSPLIAYMFPKLTPYTCRIPSHVERMRRNAEQRRATSYQALQGLTDQRAIEKAANGHIARVLGLGSRAWDRVGLAVPLASWKVNKAVQTLVEDDFKIKSGGGVDKVHGDEVVLAAEKRGLDVRGRSVSDLRVWLDDWVAQSTKGSEDEGKATLRRLLMESPDKKTSA